MSPTKTKASKASKKKPSAPKTDTPLMRQYKAIKAQVPHAILFYRLGDFYEMFGDDAVKAAPALGVVLTQRQGIPLCGVPYHSHSTYLAKLLKAGFKVAIAEQTEDPAKAKGIVARKIVRLVTPGTVVEDELLESKAVNYLVAIVRDIVGWGLAAVDASTGEFWATQRLNDPGREQLRQALAFTAPAEVVVDAKTKEELELEAWLPPGAAVSVHEAPPEPAEVPAHWPEDEHWPERPLALKAALKARRYLFENDPRERDLLACRYRELGECMQLDETALRTLEIVDSSSGDRRFTLWGALDRARTAMGSRRLKAWLLAPLTDAREIGLRQGCVQELLDNEDARASLFELLRGTADLERVLSRLSTSSAGPRDLAGLRDALARMPALSAWFLEHSPYSDLATIGRRHAELADRLEPTASLLEKALAEEVPAKLSDGGVIRSEHHKELAELRALREDSQSWLARFAAREKERTGIGTLRVGYNSVFGYYIEVTKTWASKVPDDYARKQTLTNAERYITPELKKMETKILHAEERIQKLEAELFHRLREEALDAHADALAYARGLGELDVFASLAETAAEGGWVKPKVDLSFALEIEEGRHPVVEAALPAGTFVPNGVSLDSHGAQIAVLTGPNMSGKSTYLRQNALIAILAQIGSFVPAKSARVGVVDRVLTRIGAQDALARGESTFMVEMKETASILRQATPRALIVLDEVGRGTSTFDGISIAWAVLEHLHSPSGGPRTLFATHYFELTALADKLAGISNFNVQAREWTDSTGKKEVVFLHKVAPGPADKSYGIHVGELAGLPGSVVKRSQEILASLEKGASPKEPAAKKPLDDDAPMLPLFSSHPLLDELRMIEPEKLSPLEALQLLARWKKEL